MPVALPCSRSALGARSPVRCLLLLAAGVLVPSAHAATSPTQAAPTSAPALTAPAPAPVPVPAAPTTADPDPRWIIDGDAQYEGGAGVFAAGFVVRHGDLLILGDAARYEPAADLLYASGRLLLTLPGLRIEAERLGLRHAQRFAKARTDDAGTGGASGEIWNLTALIEARGSAPNAPGQRLRLRCAHATIDGERIVLHDAVADGGHGGIFGLWLPRLTIHLRPAAVPGRDRLHAYVEGISAVSPTATVTGIPVLWLPYAYRDFQYDWPWSQVEAGTSRRLGTYARYWVGVGLPPFADWKVRVEARADAHTFAGPGYGAGLDWRHPEAGHGRLRWYEMPREAVRGGGDDRDGLATRRARAVDAEHRLGIPGGALSARFISLPEADPLVPGGLGNGLPPDERFRADHLRRDLDQRPLARNGVTIATGGTLATLVADIERNRHIDRADRERFWSVQGVLPRTALIGPLHAAGSAWIEDLRLPAVDGQDPSRAIRTTADAHLGADHWWSGVGGAVRAGMRWLSYDQGERNGTDIGYTERHVPFAEALLRLRFEGHFAPEAGDSSPALVHRFTPLLGVELIGTGEGGAPAGFDFRDGRDGLAEDARYGLIGGSTVLRRERTLFTADVLIRIALRDRDRVLTDPLATQRYVAPDRFVDATVQAEGSPWRDVVLGTQARYDHRSDTWTRCDAYARWTVVPRVLLRDETSLLPDQNGPLATVPGARPGSGDWQHRPGISAFADRYRFDLTTTLRPGGKPIDAWQVDVLRRMVDGELSLSFGFFHTPSGGVQDRRIGIGFTLAGTARDEDDRGHPSTHAWSIR